MQVSATLIAAQQAAREAQAKFHSVHVTPPQAGFSAALDKVAPKEADNFAPLPLKQTAPTRDAAPQAAPPAPTGRLGTMVNILI